MELIVCFDEEFYDSLDLRTGLPFNFSDNNINIYEEEYEYAAVEEAI